MDELLGRRPRRRVALLLGHRATGSSPVRLGLAKDPIAKDPIAKDLIAKDLIVKNDLIVMNDVAPLHDGHPLPASFARENQRPTALKLRASWK
jgi:hypothetical protein